MVDLFRLFGRGMRTALRDASTDDAASRARDASRGVRRVRPVRDRRRRVDDARRRATRGAARRRPDGDRIVRRRDVSLRRRRDDARDRARER